ncbi:peptidoglycan DD-metalloendopeptidase family protein [Tabrizicola sp. BL-A-41-H6]|uniref:peptidoglycan DD-metalloendopeptidase family protein n=1 Tax=Tabrizicola sp. BL-A-41-H6 TaxID=3421107 RepID=UPI003D6681E5
MMQFSGFPMRSRAALVLGVSLAALTACVPVDTLDWDLRNGAGNTSDEARQATAAAPMPDANGILSYPGYQLVKARRGDTVAAVAMRLGVNPEQLAQTNALRPTDPLRDGELLLLPQRVAAAPQPAMIGGTGAVDITSIATTALDQVGPSATAPAAAPAGAEPLRHRVARGETAFTIARTYNVSAKALADWNGLGSDLAVREGQTLIIPVVTGPAPVLEPVPTPPGQGSPTPTPPSAAKPLPDEKTEVAAAPAKATPPSPDLGAQRSDASALAMPAAGKIIRGYDKKKNQGIDIAAAPGSPVKAAADGTVAAITKDTNQVPIVVIRHADNLLTVYAGVDALKVKKGDKVKRGQSIAVIRPGDPAFLHFEVRKGVDSLDPMTFLQ